MGVSEMVQNSLIIYNFGYDKPLPFPSIALTPKTKLRLNLQSSGLQSQSRRSIAVIGKKYMGKFEDIMLDIERIHEDTQALPLAIFVQTKSEDNLSKLSSHPMRVTPYLVGILLWVPAQFSQPHTSVLSYWSCPLRYNVTSHRPFQSSEQILLTLFRYKYLKKGRHTALSSRWHVRPRRTQYMTFCWARKFLTKASKRFVVGNQRKSTWVTGVIGEVSK